MKYVCTRNENENVTAAQAICRGISPSGGLYVPETFPAYGEEDFQKLQKMSYPQRAAYIMKDFLTDFTPEEVAACAQAAYAPEKFGGENPAPISHITASDGAEMYVLELWHGPTCAFKDMALQMLPHLLTRSMKKVQPGETAVILTATSGDTGKAALEGFKDVDGVKIIVFYPQDGVSDMQKRQMTTQEGSNVGVSAIYGNFDDAQTGVKKIFTDERIKDILKSHHMSFSSANSINWGRLLPQIVYYFSAYCEMLKTGEITPEEKINIVVPTGNFGNILAAYYAVRMGLPVNRLICASNENNVLTEFLQQGVYNRNRPFHTTISPSMDILISSNLERLLYDMSGSDMVARWMDELAREGRYQVDLDTMLRLQSLFSAGFCSDEETKETIRNFYEKYHYLCDTHTAVALKVYQDYVQYTCDYDTKAIIASTASPYKFADSVLSSVSSEDISGLNEIQLAEKLSEITDTDIPAPIASLQEKKIRFPQVCRAGEMEDMVYRFIGI